MGYTVEDTYWKGTKVVIITAVGDHTQEEWDSFKEFYKNIFENKCTDQFPKIALMWDLREGEILSFKWIYEFATMLQEIKDQTETKLYGCSFLITNWVLEQFINNILVNVFPIQKPFRMCTEPEEGYAFINELKNMDSL